MGPPEFSELEKLAEVYLDTIAGREHKDNLYDEIFLEPKSLNGKRAVCFNGRIALLMEQNSALRTYAKDAADLRLFLKSGGWAYWIIDLEDCDKKSDFFATFPELDKEYGRILEIHFSWQRAVLQALRRIFSRITQAPRSS